MKLPFHTLLNRMVSLVISYDVFSSPIEILRHFLVLHLQVKADNTHQQLLLHIEHANKPSLNSEPFYLHEESAVTV